MQVKNNMGNLSVINKFLYLINSIFLCLLLFSYLSPFIKPSLFWPISFLGLLFPIFYIINILFLSYWIFFWKRQAWSNIIILIIGIQYLGLFIGNQRTNSSINNSIKVMSYNVRLFNKYEWIPKINIQSEIFRLFKEVEPDILCIQEFYTNKDPSNLNYKYKHLGLQAQKNKWNMAIYSKYPQINKGTISIKGKQMNNTCIYSDLFIYTDTIRVYNIHLASNWFNNNDYSFFQNPNQANLRKGIQGIIQRMKNSYKKRGEEAEIIKTHIEASPFPVIVTGDFNDTPLSYAYNTISTDLQDAFERSGKGTGKSFVKIPGLRIDYILHDKKLKSYNYIQHKEVLSDHYPISCEIEILTP